MAEMFDHEKFSKEDLLGLYKLEIERENEIRARWRTSSNVYLTMILSIISGIFVLANFLSQTNIGALCFIVGGVIVIALSIIAFLHFKLDYRYQMEILSIQAKIEDMLGLTSPEKCSLPPRWGDEGMLPPWYYSDKNIPSSSEEFIKKMCSMKKTNFYPVIYIVFSAIGILLIILGLLTGMPTCV